MREVDPLDLVETIREGLLVLDPDLTVQFANRSFCDTFAATPEETVGLKLYELGNGQWDNPELRSLIEAILPEHATIEAFEIDRVFPSIGRRVMLLNARKVYRHGKQTQQVLLAIEDVTERRRLEHEHAVAHERIAALLQELGHRSIESHQPHISMAYLPFKTGKLMLSVLAVTDPSIWFYNVGGSGLCKGPKKSLAARRVCRFRRGCPASHQCPQGRFAAAFPFSAPIVVHR